MRQALRSTDARLDDLIEAWLELCEARLAPSTVVSYRHDLMAVAERLDATGGVQPRLRDLTEAALQAAFTAWAAGRRPGSVLRAHSCWTGFLDFLRAEGLVQHNAMADVPKPSRSRRATLTPRALGEHLHDDGITPDEAARRLGVGVDAVLRLVAEEEIPAYDGGQGMRIPVGDVDGYLSRSRISPGDLAHLRSPPAASTPKAGLEMER